MWMSEHISTSHRVGVKLWASSPSARRTRFHGVQPGARAPPPHAVRLPACGICADVCACKFCVHAFTGLCYFACACPCECLRGGRCDQGWGWHIPQPVQQQGLRQGHDPVCQNTPADTCSTAPKGRRYQTGERRRELIDKGAQRRGREQEGDGDGGHGGTRRNKMQQA